jgi:uncharacterized protein (DUF302 family)
MAPEGLVAIASNKGVTETIDRLKAALESKGVTIFARIDHAAGAKAAGMELRPTQLLIFGNPKAGTPLMQASQTIGIDLPLKALAWEDAAGRVWLSYIDPLWLAARYALGAPTKAPANALAATLDSLVKEAAAA